MAAAVGAHGCHGASLQQGRGSVLQVRCGTTTVGRSRRLGGGDGPYPSGPEPASRQVQLVSRPPPAQQHEPRLLPKDAMNLTNQIKRCTRWEQLQHLCARSGRQFNHINLSAAITHVAQLQEAAAPSPQPQPQPRQHPDDHLPSTSYSSPPPRLPPGAAMFMNQLLQAAGHNMGGFGTRQLANMLWAVAKVGHRPSPAWLSSVVASSGQLWGQYEAQQLANMAHALATIPHDPGRLWLEQLLQDSLRLVEAFKPQELSNLIYAVSILCERQRPPSLQPWLQAMTAHTSDSMQLFNGQELAMLAWGMARIAEQAGSQALLLAARKSRGRSGVGGVGGGGWMYRLLAAAQERLHAQDLTPQGIACILLASTNLRHRPPDSWLRHACLYAQAALEAQAADTSQATLLLQSRLGMGAAARSGWGGRREGFSTQALCNILLGLARTGYAPSEPCMLTFEAAMARRMRAALLAPHGGAAAAGADVLLPQHLGNVLWSMARTGWTPSAGFMRLHLVCTASLAPSFTAMQLVTVLWSLTKLRIRLSRECLEMLCIQMFSSLSSLRDKEAAMALQALAWQRYTPCAAWMHAIGRAAAALLPAMPPRRLAMFLSYMAHLGHRPSAQWTAAWAEAAQARVQQFNAADASSALWAVQVLDLAVPEALAAGLLQRFRSQLRSASLPQLLRVLWALRIGRPAGGGARQAPEQVEQALAEIAALVSSAADDGGGGGGPQQRRLVEPRLSSPEELPASRAGGEEEGGEGGLGEPAPPLPDSSVTAQQLRFVTNLAALRLLRVHNVTQQHNVA